MKNNLAVVKNLNEVHPGGLTEKQQEAEAIEYDRIITGSLFDLLCALKGMEDKKYYLRFGFDSLADYCREKLDMAKQTMYHYLNVADKFLIPGNTGKVSHERLSAIGVGKLKILTGLGKNMTSELMATGEIKLNGKIYSFEDFVQMKRSALVYLISGKEPELEEDEPKQNGDDIPFDTAYRNTEKHFQIVINNIENCSSIKREDRRRILKLIVQAAEIMESILGKTK